MLQKGSGQHAAGRTDSHATDALGNITVIVIHVINDGLERWPVCEPNNR